jgi:hypothetical protein
MKVEVTAPIGGLEQTLPSSWYYADDIYALEKERIFCREWLCVAREEELPAPGDFRIVDVVGESIILVRNRQGALRAFYNVCGKTTRRAFPTLNPDEQERHKGEVIYPNLFVSLACDHAAVFIVQPRGPERTDIVCHGYYAPMEDCSLDIRRYVRERLGPDLCIR